MEISKDSLEDILNGLGINFIKISNLSLKKFIFTFFEQEDMKAMWWEEVKIWIKAKERTKLEDLVLPRVT